MKSSTFCFFAIVVLAGCTTISPREYRQFERYGDRNTVYTTCTPYQADGLMSWALALEGKKEHTRSAVARNENGWVECRSHERAKSSLKGENK